MAQGPYLRKYGVQTTVDFHTFEVDGVDLRKDAAPGTADLFVMKDEGAEAAATNAATDEGRGYSLVLTATEMQAARIAVYVEDQTATKVWLDTVLVIETYGDASAMHAFDLDDSVRGGMTALPNAAADAIGGLPISDAGGLDLDAKLANTNEVTVARMGALTDWINGGRLDSLLDAIPTTAMRGTDGANTTTPLTAAGTRSAVGLASANMDTQFAASATATGFSTHSVADVLTTQMTEAYAANGVAPTLAQAQFAIHQMLMQFGIASTSLTVRKLDDTTTAFVVTLDDDTAPTDAKRV